MTKQELITRIADATNKTKIETTQFLDAFISAVQEGVADGEKITLVGFGVFDATHKAARTGRNPANGEPINIEAKISPKFTPGSEFKRVVQRRLGK